MKYETKKDKTLLIANYDAATRFVKKNETNNTVINRMSENHRVSQFLNILLRDLELHHISYHFTKTTDWGKLKELVYDEELSLFIHS